MQQELTNAEKIRRLPWNIALNATNNVYATLTLFGSSFVLFLNKLGVNNSDIGFLLSLLPFSGIVAIFIAPTVARFGYKRTWVLFFGTRKLITAALLLVPLVLMHLGRPAVMVLITAVMAGFALCRAIAETALYPWSQEYIPNSVRGKHSAINDMISRVTSIAAIAFAGYVLGVTTGLNGFMILFAVALVFGVFSVWSSTHLPGGAPTNAKNTSVRDYLQVLKDRNFVLFMAGLGTITLANSTLAFLPLFMQNQVGLSDSAVVLLQMGPVIGGFSATYLFGWAADRYGSKPVMLVGLYIKILLPIAWILMPRNSPLSLAVAMVIAFVWGIAEIGWGIGFGRLLFVSAVPYAKRAEYMAVFYALAGLIGGVSQNLSGQLLDASSGVSGQFLFFTLDQFTPLFVLTLVLTVVGVILFYRVKGDSGVSVGEFAGMFIHGNPVMAFGSLIGYYRARDEHATVVSTERMGKTKSPLTVDELLETLKDPRFNVRFEAIISIARMGPEPRLIEALSQFVNGTELSLSVIAAWALGRIGDESAIPPLRQGLNSPYRSIQAHCARSLGTLNDQEVAPILLERLQNETDKGLRNAYASAVGNLRMKAAVDTLFEVLETTENEGARTELALAIARVVGGEHHFIRLLRGLRQDRGTTTSQVLMATRRRWGKALDDDIQQMLGDCANTFAAEQVDEGVTLLVRLIRQLPPAEATDKDEQVGRKVLNACADKLESYAADRFEYLLLALHTLQVTRIE